MRLSLHAAVGLLNVVMREHEAGHIPDHVFHDWEAELWGHITAKQLPVKPLRVYYFLHCIVIEGSDAPKVFTQEHDMVISPAIILPQIERKG